MGKMTDGELRRVIRDAADYAKDARSAARLRLGPGNLLTVQRRLEAARDRIDAALAERSRSAGETMTTKSCQGNRQYLASFAVVLVVVAILYRFAPIGIDWQETFSRLGIRDPYRVETFFNPPFVTLLLPHALFPLRLGNAVNLMLNVVVLLIAIRVLGGNRAAILLVFTSPVFFDLCGKNNVEWIPLLGLIVGPELGGMLLLCKPQSLAGCFLIWAKRGWRVILAPLGLLAISFLVWGFWPSRLAALPAGKPWNCAVFPFGVPFGLYLLYRAWRADDPFLAAVATPLLIPYLHPSSLTGVLCVLACKFPKAAVWLYVGLWGFIIVKGLTNG